MAPRSKFKSVMCLGRRSGTFTERHQHGSVVWLQQLTFVAQLVDAICICQVVSLLQQNPLVVNSILSSMLSQLYQVATFEIRSKWICQVVFDSSSRVTLNGYGTIEDVTGGTGGIFIPLKSNFNFFAGGRFSSTVATFLRVFDTTTGSTIGAGFRLSASLTGPLFVGVSSSGDITTSTTSKKHSSFYLV